MKILVTGGAGYIGSFMTKRLLDDGHSVVVLDNLVRSTKDTIDNRAEFLNGNILDKNFLKTVFNQEFDGIIHFAGYISMGESMENPGIYFENNTFGVVNILEELKSKKNKNIIFSSTAGVYGNPIKTPIPEDHPKTPTNPYGESKLMTERILSWYSDIFNVNSMSLRYFNASGAGFDGTMGENHNPESHIIPNAMHALLKQEEFILYGDDYATVDGTCVRDYIHVLDLVEAHMLALEKLIKNPGKYVYNVGTGKGYSNKQVLDAIKKITGKDLRVKVDSRRSGDAEELVADASKIKQELGFNPQYSDLETIIESAWKWHSNNS